MANRSNRATAPFIFDDDGIVEKLRNHRLSAPVLKVEPNRFDDFDLRQSDGKLVRCEKKSTGATECRVVQEKGCEVSGVDRCRNRAIVEGRRVEAGPPCGAAALTPPT